MARNRGNKQRHIAPPRGWGSGYSAGVNRWIDRSLDRSLYSAGRPMPVLAALAWCWALLGASGGVQAQSRPMPAAVLPSTPADQAQARAAGWPQGWAAQASAAAQQAAQSLAPAGAQVRVTPLAWDHRLQLAPCAQTEAFLAAGQPAWGRTRVGLRCTDGRSQWTVFAPVQVQVWAPALVLRDALPAGARLGAGQWVEQTVDWAALPGAPLTDQNTVVGRALARPLAAGEALRETHLQPLQWFSSGATVQVVAAGNGFSISTDALALGHGVQGQPVRVRTEGGRVLVGRATGAARVEVSL
jgi:flagellar basal body P-ring formation protein FlgA